MVALDTLPDFAPSPSFADGVMRQVQVFEPWHVAAVDRVRELVPASRPARLVAGLGAAVSAGLLTAAGTWAVARADVAMFMTQIGLERFREQAGAALSDLTVTLVGQPGLDALRTGGPETLALATGAFVATVGAGVVGLRALAGAARRTR